MAKTGIQGSIKEFEYKLTLGTLKQNYKLVNFTSEANYSRAPFGVATLIVGIKDYPSLKLSEIPSITVEFKIATYGPNALPANEKPVTFTYQFTPIRIARKWISAGTTDGKNKFSYYEISCSYPGLLTEALASRFTKHYYGTPKKVIEDALKAAGVKPADFKLTKLKSAPFTKIEGDFVQTSDQTTQDFVMGLLAEYSGAVYLKAQDQTLHFSDSADYVEEGKDDILLNATTNSALAIDTGTPPDYHGYPINQTISIYDFCHYEETPPVGKITLSAFNPASDKQLLSNTTDVLPNKGEYNLVLSNNLTADDLKKYGQNILESLHTYSDFYTGRVNIPMHLGVQYDVSYVDNGTTKKVSLTPISVKATVNFTGMDKDVFGLAATPPNQFYWDVVFIETTTLARVMFNMPTNTPLSFYARVLADSGKTDGIPSKGKKIKCGLLHDHARKANEDFAIVEVETSTQPASFTSAAPAPGDIVELHYHPRLRRFVLVGTEVREFSHDATITNPSNAQHEVTAKTIMKPESIETTVDTTKIEMDMETFKISVSDNLAILDKKGTEFIAKEKLKAKGKSVNLQGMEKLNADAPELTLTGSKEFSLSGPQGEVKAKSGKLKVKGSPIDNNG